MFSDAKHIIHYMWIHCCEQNQGLEEVKLLQAMIKKNMSHNFPFLPHKGARSQFQNVLGFIQVGNVS